MVEMDINKREVIDFTKAYNQVDKQTSKVYPIKQYDVINKTKTTATIIVTTENSIEYECKYFIKAIYQMITDNQPLDLRYTYIEKFVLSKVIGYEEKELIAFDAEYSIWSGGISFKGATFSDSDISFAYATFGDGFVSFDDVHFNNGDVYFEETSFGNGSVSFDNAIFGDGDISFFDTIFGDGDVSFYKTIFGDGTVRFNLASFGEGNVNFHYANFGEGDVNFLNTSFGNCDVIFEYVNFGDGDVIFEDATFGDSHVAFYETTFGNGDISFTGATFGDGDLLFEYVSFGDGDVVFYGSIKNKGRMCFDWVKYGSGEMVFSVNVETLIFRNTEVNNRLEISESRIENLIIENCLIRDVVIMNNITINSLSLLNTINLGKIFIKYKIKNIKGKNHSIHKALKSYKLKEDKEERNFTNVEMIDQLLMLKENFRNIGYYDDEDSTYRDYMKYKTNQFPYWLLKLFSCVGGYGTKPFKIIATMLLTWGGFAAGYFLILTNQFEPLKYGVKAVRSFWDALYYSGITFLTIGYGEISPALEGSTALRLISIAEGFIGLFLMSYLTVSVVRKILR